MKAVQFMGSVPRYLSSKLLGEVSQRAYYSRWSNIVLRDVEEPRLPSPNWVKVRTRYAGICGSDINLVLLHDSPYTSPFVSMPFTMGHENCGAIAEIGEGVEGLSPGQRVVIDPVLACEAREIPKPCSHCRSGDYSLCENFTHGVVSPGMAIGMCRDTGGGWSEFFVAHKSQVIPLPDEVSDEDAVLIDPFCSALHPVMRNFPRDEDTCLIIGAGIIGVSIVAALRSLGSKARIIVLARYPFQAELARNYGASEVVCSRTSRDYYQSVAGLLGARLLKPLMGKRVVQGGADVVYECVGSSESIDDALRFTRPGGTMVLVGLASFPHGIDWTPIWFKEIKIQGSFFCSSELYEGKRTSTYRMALDLLRKGKIGLKPLLTHKFRLEQYREAIEASLHKGKNRLVKAAFVFD